MRWSDVADGSQALIDAHGIEEPDDPKGPVRIWSPISGEIVRELLEAGDSILNRPIGADSLIVAARSGEVLAVDLLDERIRWRMSFAMPHCAAVSRDSSLVVVCSGSRVTVLDAERGDVVWESEDFVEPVKALFVGRLWLKVVTSDGIATLAIQNTTDWHRRLPRLDFEIHDVSDDGLRATFGRYYDDGPVGVLDTESQEVLVRAKGVRLVSDGAEALAVAPGAGAESGAVLRWRTSDGQQLLGPEGADTAPWFALSPDERFVVARAGPARFTGAIPDYLLNLGLFFPQWVPWTHAPAHVLDAQSGRTLGVISNRVISNRLYPAESYSATSTTITVCGQDGFLRVFAADGGRSLWGLFVWALLPPAALAWLVWRIRRWRTRAAPVIAP
ncbi:MAG: PQQ-binding-like beta-propeller repeat protein [Planctomyces sp.]|nr:PQQ-binding-like beta-propeller repeat protein [Planctomyces sp.]